MSLTDLPLLPLPEGIQESYMKTHDLNYHILYCGPRDAPLILLLHGFPEIAYSWRKIMLPLSKLGYHVVAYDQRGFGRTTGWDTSEYKDVDLNTFSMPRIVTDALRLLNTLGYLSVHCVVGHDFGAVAASMCALMRPDIFKSVVIMSHPFKGAPKFPFPSRPSTTQKRKQGDIHKELAALPSPRKAYKWYYSSEPANKEMTEPKEGILEFLRGYFYLKSASWEGNKPHKLEGWVAEEMAKMPYYYVMPLHADMRESVRLDMEKEDEKEVREKMDKWLPDPELAIYAEEYARNSFQGGLNWYRRFTQAEAAKDMELFMGKQIEVPIMFISGRQDWGMYQDPGALESLESGEAVKEGMYAGTKVVDGAGHWVQQEKPEEVLQLLEGFLQVLN